MPASSQLRDSFVRSFPNDAVNFESSRFRNCCGCHVRKCAFTIGLLELIALVASVLATALAYGLLWQTDESGQSMPPWGHHASLSLVGALASFVIGCIVIGFLFCGLCKEKPFLLLPHMIIQFLAIVSLLATVVIFVYIAALSAEDKIHQFAREVKRNQTTVNNATADRNQSKHWPQLGPDKMFIYSVVISSMCALAAVLEIYFLVAMYRAYSYFCAKRDQLKQTEPVKLWSTGHHFRSNSLHDPSSGERMWSEA